MKLLHLNVAYLMKYAHNFIVFYFANITTTFSLKRILTNFLPNFV